MGLFSSSTVCWLSNFFWWAKTRPSLFNRTAFSTLPSNATCTMRQCLQLRLCKHKFKDWRIQVQHFNVIMFCNPDAVCCRLSINRGDAINNVCTGWWKGQRRDARDEKNSKPTVTIRWTAVAHLCWLCNMLSIHEGEAGMCVSKPNSAREVPIKHARLGWRTVFTPSSRVSRHSPIKIHIPIKVFTCLAAMGVFSFTC